MLFNIIKTIKLTFQYYTFILFVCKCMDEDDCGKVVYKIGYMTKSGVKYLSDNVFPHVEDALKYCSGCAKSSLASTCKYLYVNYINGFNNTNYHIVDEIEYVPTTSVMVDDEEFVMM